ncbi:MAG TPA: hypothetical protein VJB02_05820 [Coxiellaceae bacterium]|nr:hypothetical protein [Coxiellaceae bacterium]
MDFLNCIRTALGFGKGETRKDTDTRGRVDTAPEDATGEGMPDHPSKKNQPDVKKDSEDETGEETASDDGMAGDDVFEKERKDDHL